MEGERQRDRQEGEKSDRGERTARGGREEVRMEKLKWLSRSLFSSLLVILVFYPLFLPLVSTLFFLFYPLLPFIVSSLHLFVFIPAVKSDGNQAQEGQKAETKERYSVAVNLKIP